MKSNMGILKWTLCLMMIGKGTAGKAETLDSSQILLLMESSRSRYQTIEAVIEAQEYEWKDRSDGEMRLVASQQLTMRSSPHKTFMSEEAKLFLEDTHRPTYQKEIIVGSSNLWKHFLHVQEFSKSDDKTGFISNKPPAGRRHGVLESVWGLGGYGERNWNKIGKMVKTAGTVCMEDGLIRLETPTKEGVDSPWLIVWVDPQREYVPVRHTVLYSDKKSLFLTQSSSNWTKIKSLWVPLSYNRYVYPINSRQDYTVVSIKMNESISPSDWDFQFPIGTMVENKVLNVRYEVRDSQVLASSTSLVEYSGEKSFYSDQQLSEAVAKVRDLPLAENKPVSGGQGDFGFTQDHVWVLPGKNQYTLELGLTTKTKPVLSGKSISDSPLVFHGVDDQLAASGKLVVTLERPEGHNAFADAVLTLDFAGTKTPIHFVAAPLP